MEFYPEQLKKIRTKSGLTVVYIVKKLNIGRSTYWNWENSVRVPSEHFVRELGKLFNVNVTELSDLKEAKKKSADSIENWEQITNDRGKELALKQKAALNIFEETTEELNKVWSVVHAMMNSLNSIIYIKDKKSSYVLANNAFRENLGLLSSYRVSGKSDSDFYSTKEAKDIYNEDLSIIDSGRDITNKVDNIPGSRKKKVGLISKHPIHDYKGDVSGLISICEDISAIKELRKTSLLLEKAFQSSNGVAAIFDKKNGKQVFLSQSAEEQTGYTCNEFSNFKDFISKLHPDDQEKERMYKKTLKYPDYRQFRIFKKNGELVWLETSRTTIEHGDKEYNCSVTRDITEIKKADKKIRELNNIIESIDNIVVWRAIVDDSSGKFNYTFISNNIERIIGYSPSDLTNRSTKLFNIIHPEHRDFFSEWIKDKNFNMSIDHKILCSDKTEKWVETKLFTKEIDGRKIVTGTHSNITSRRKNLISSLRQYGVNEDTIKKVLNEVQIY